MGSAVSWILGRASDPMLKTLFNSSRLLKLNMKLKYLNNKHKCKTLTILNLPNTWQQKNEILDLFWEPPEVILVSTRTFWTTSWNSDSSEREISSSLFAMIQKRERHKTLLFKKWGYYGFLFLLDGANFRGRKAQVGRKPFLLKKRPTSSSSQVGQFWT